MTSYNRELFIAEAIESVLALNYTNFELIIVDDCSTDRTVSVAQKYVDVDERIRLYVNDQNLGDYNNRNRAATFAKGKYLKYLDSDDIIFEWGLGVMVDCMEKYPDAALGVSQHIGFNIIYPKWVAPIQIYRLYYYRNLLLVVGPTATIIRRDIFENSGGFSGEKYLGDTELWLKISQKYPLVLIPPGQIYWREHEGQQISQERKELSVEAFRQQLNERILLDKDCPLPVKESSAIIRNLLNIKCRRVFQCVLRGDVFYAIARRKYLKFGIMDFLFALKKNKVPDQSFLNL